MKNVFRVAAPISVIVVGWLILFRVGNGVTVNGSWREFAGAFLVAVGILLGIAVWTKLWVEDTL